MARATQRSYLMIKLMMHHGKKDMVLWARLRALGQTRVTQT